MEIRTWEDLRTALEDVTSRLQTAHKIIQIIPTLRKLDERDGDITARVNLVEDLYRIAMRFDRLVRVFYTAEGDQRLVRWSRIVADQLCFAFAQIWYAALVMDPRGTRDSIVPGVLTTLELGLATCVEASRMAEQELPRSGEEVH